MFHHLCHPRRGRIPPLLRQDSEEDSRPAMGYTPIPKAVPVASGHWTGTGQAQETRPGRWTEDEGFSRKTGLLSPEEEKEDGQVNKHMSARRGW